MDFQMSKPIKFFVVFAVFGILPIIPLLIAFLIAGTNGCALSSENINPCFILGIDFGNLLDSMVRMAKLLLLTIPIGLIGAIILVIWFIMNSKMSKPIKSFVASVIFGILPIIPVLIALLVATTNGCALSSENSNPCFILGIDFENLLNLMSMMMFLLFVTIPIGLIGAIISVIWLIVVMLGHENQKKMDSYHASALEPENMSKLDVDLPKEDEIKDSMKDSIKKFLKREPRFDPASFNDEIALLTEWTSATRVTGGCTHYLKEASYTKVMFVVRPLTLILSSIFIVIGLVIFGLLGSEATRMPQKDIYIGILFGIIFFSAGFFILRSCLIPRNFDKTVGYYWKGKASLQTSDIINIKDQCKLSDLHAIQLLQKYHSNGKKNSYYSYELNLIKKDGGRFNVIAHNALSLIRTDSEKLSKFLDIPVWDSISV
ncbi:hypothetical protein QUF74_14990 [Candidatus Halobeggiatoa sp. HSG11]|nr:hypothetical protein [Candidatus Halobeggiatoa sp. HSG11]